MPFPTHIARNISPIVRIDNNATIGLTGDWGTGDASSRSIAQRMTDLKPDHTIHLGDIYYAGAENEVRNKFLALWPAGTSPNASSFALNGNHEMYSGGIGYFQVALTDPRFKAQQGLELLFAAERSLDNNRARYRLLCAQLLPRRCDRRGCPTPLADGPYASRSPGRPRASSCSPITPASTSNRRAPQ